MSLMLAIMRDAAGLCLLLVMSACGQEPPSLPARRQYQMSQASPALLRAAFAEQYERLVRVKRKYDPGNVFRINQTIT